VNEKGEKERPVVIHRAISGSLERFMGVLIEHFAGKFPVWLAPVQATILPISEKFADYGKKTYDTLIAAGIRAELSEANESLGKRIREAEMMKVPYILVVGEKEEGGGTVNVRDRKGEENEIALAEFVKKIEGEIKEKTL
jgi:threonyl-tRNA synthetase